MQDSLKKGEKKRLVYALQTRLRVELSNFKTFS